MGCSLVLKSHWSGVLMLGNIAIYIKRTSASEQGKQHHLVAIKTFYAESDPQSAS